jgi:hypothetical protein
MLWWPFKKGAQATNSIRTIIIGGFLMYFAIFVILPQLFVMGYLVRVLRYSLNKDVSPPVFDEWGRLLIDGTKAYTIWIAYLLLPIALLLSAQQEVVTNELVLLVLGLFFGGILGGVLSIMTGGTAAGITDQFGGTFTSLIINVVHSLGILEALSITLPFILVLYVAPAGLVNFVEKESSRSGFDIRDFTNIILNRWYLAGWLLYMTLWMVSSSFLSGGFFYNLNTFRNFFNQYGLSTVGSTLAESLLTLSTFISFYLIVIGYYAIGRSWIYASRSETTPVEFVLSTLDKTPVSTVLVGAFLLSTGTILTGIFVMGYLVRLLQSEERNGLPTFDNWTRLFTDGAKSFVIYLCYVIIPIIILSFQVEPFTSYLAARGLLLREDAPESLVFFIVISAIFTRLFSLSIAMNLSSDVLSILNDVHMIIGTQPNQTITDPLTLSLLIILSLLITYMFPLALANFATKNRINAGFEFRRLSTIALKKEYAILWSKLVVLWMIGGTLLSGRSLWRRAPVQTEIRFLPSFSGRLLESITAGEFLPGTYSIWIEGIPIVSIGTSYGLVSAGSLLLFSIINFCILIYTYRRIGRFWKNVNESTD